MVKNQVERVMNYLAFCISIFVAINIIHYSGAKEYAFFCVSLLYLLMIYSYYLSYRLYLEVENSTLTRSTKITVYGFLLLFFSHLNIYPGSLKIEDYYIKELQSTTPKQVKIISKKSHQFVYEIDSNLFFISNKHLKEVYKTEYLLKADNYIGSSQNTSLETVYEDVYFGCPDERTALTVFDSTTLQKYKKYVQTTMQ